MPDENPNPAPQPDPPPVEQPDPEDGSDVKTSDKHQSG